MCPDPQDAIFFFPDGGNNKRVLYLVRWLNYPERKDWMEEPFDNFSVEGREKLRKFHQQNPDAPRDYRLTEG